MKQYSKAVLLAYLFSISFGYANQSHEETDIKNATDAVKESATWLSFPTTRACINSLSNKGGYIDLSFMNTLMLPGAILFDTLAFTASCVVTPVLSVRLGIKQVINKIDDLLNEHSADELTKMVLLGFKTRLNEVKKSLDKKLIDKEIKPEDLNIILMAMIFANTAWDSKDTAPDYLILGTGKKLKKKILENHYNEIDTNSLALYNQLAKISESISSEVKYHKVTKESLMVELSTNLISNNGQDRRNLISDLKEASKLAQSILSNIPKILKEDN